MIINDSLGQKGVALSTVTLLAQLAHKRTPGFIADFNQRVVFEDMCAIDRLVARSVAIPRIARYENVYRFTASWAEQCSSRLLRAIKINWVTGAIVSLRVSAPSAGPFVHARHVINWLACSHDARIRAIYQMFSDNKFKLYIYIYIFEKYLKGHYKDE